MTSNVSDNCTSSSVASKPLLVRNTFHGSFLFCIFSEALNNFLKKPHVHEQCRNLTLPGTVHANSWQVSVNIPGQSSTGFVGSMIEEEK